MATTINDYTNGSTGTISSNGVTVGYTVSETGDVQNGGYSDVEEGAKVTTNAGVPASTTVQFDQDVVGMEIFFAGMDIATNIEVWLNGTVANLSDLIQSGDARLENAGTGVYVDSEGHIKASNSATSPEHENTAKLILNVPVHSIALHQASGILDANTIDIGLSSDVYVAPCFTAGTLIDTDQGPVAVENLQVGDLIRTKDHGFQPVKWVGGSRVMDRAVRIAKGTFGNARDLVVSPRHRMLLKGWQMGLLFNHDEAFAAAKDMQNGTTITVEPEGWVTYYHVLLDRHEVIFAEGAETESFFPDEASLNGMAKATREELAQAADLSTFGRTVRPTLTANQAMYLSHNMDLLEDEQGQIAAE